MTRKVEGVGELKGAGGVGGVGGAGSPGDARWRVSSFSGTYNHCVEVAVTTATAAGVGAWLRDTKARDAGELATSTRAWVGLVAWARDR